MNDIQRHDIDVAFALFIICLIPLAYLFQKLLRLVYQFMKKGVKWYKEYYNKYFIFNR